MKKKRGCLGKVLIVFVVLIIGFVAIVMFATKTSRKDADYHDITWPSSTLAQTVPEPQSLWGEIITDSETSLLVYVGNISQDDYTKYVDSCMTQGFDVDYYNSDSSYHANNADGYYISVIYDDEEEVMRISADSPSDDISEDENKDNAEDADPSENTNDVSNNESADGIRPEFKETIDSYEAFFDEYCAFMKKYKESSNPVELMTDYANYMSQYTETMQKFEALGDEDMSTEEALYFTEVQTRINQKLLEVAQ